MNKCDLGDDGANVCWECGRPKDGWVCHSCSKPEFKPSQHQEQIFAETQSQRVYLAQPRRPSKWLELSCKVLSERPWVIEIGQFKLQALSHLRIARSEHGVVILRTSIQGNSVLENFEVTINE